MVKYLEKEMVPYFEKWLQGNGYRVKKEVVTKEGICDLIGCLFDENKVKKRKKLLPRKHMTSEMQVAAWLSLYGKIPKNIINSKTNKRECAKLVEKGLVARNFKLSNPQKSWFPLTKEIISIELKLKNFYGAISQAQRYSNYSNRTFIGMPKEVCLKISDSKKNILKQHNIGLLSFDMNSKKITEEVKPSFKSISKFSQITHTRIAEVFWKEVLQTI